MIQVLYNLTINDIETEPKTFNQSRYLSENNFYWPVDINYLFVLTCLRYGCSFMRGFLNFSAFHLKN